MTCRCRRRPGRRRGARPRVPLVPPGGGHARRRTPDRRAGLRRRRARACRTSERPAAVEQFLWAYYGCLIMTSVGGLGFERAAGLAVATERRERPGRARCRSWASGWRTSPVGGAGPLAGGPQFVGDRPPPWPPSWRRWSGSSASRLQLPAFSALRSMRAADDRTGDVARDASRRGAVLLGLAAAARDRYSVTSASRSSSVRVRRWRWPAFPDAGGRQSLRFTSAGAPWRTMSAFALIEVVGIAYLARRSPPRRSRSSARRWSDTTASCRGSSTGLLGSAEQRSVSGSSPTRRAGRRRVTTSSTSPIRASLTRSRLPRLAVTCSLRRDHRAPPGSPISSRRSSRSGHAAAAPGCARRSSCSPRSRPSPGRPQAGTGHRAVLPRASS